jgi:hypothetical protein
VPRLCRGPHRCAGAPGLVGVAGPVGGLVRTMLRIRWRALTASSLVDDLGAVWDLRSDAPETVRAAARRSSHRRLIRRLGLRTAAGVPLEAVILAPARGVMRSKLLPAAKAIARRLFVGGIWTNERCWDLRMAPERRPCVHCGSADTLQHRLWWCICCDGRRVEVCKPGLIARARAAPPDDLLFTRGIAHLDAAGAAAPRADDVAWWWPHLPPGGVLPDLVDLFLDGSALAPTLPGLTRAGWAVVAMRPGTASPLYV